MKEKMGPLPMWMWVLLAGGTIGMVVLVKKAKGTTGTTGEVIPEVAAQAVPGGESGSAGGGTSAAGTLEAQEAKESEEISRLRGEVEGEHTATTNTGLGAGIGEVIQAKEALEALGLVRPLQGGTTEPSSQGKSPVKQATGKEPSQGISARGTYREGTFRGMAVHIYDKAVQGGVGPLKNMIVLGGPAKVTHAAAGSHAPAHASKPPAHHTAPKPTAKRPKPAAHPPARTVPAHAAPSHPAAKPAAKRAKKRR
jgi:hypothetical protein